MSSTTIETLIQGWKTEDPKTRQNILQELENWQDGQFSALLAVIDHHEDATRLCCIQMLEVLRGESLEIIQAVDLLTKRFETEENSQVKTQIEQTLDILEKKVIESK